VTDVDILYRDDDLVIVNKPSGLLVHRGWDNDDVVMMTLVRDALGVYIHPIHRLDRGASGALVFALSATAARSLCDAFAHGQVEKRYLALVRGIPPEHDVIDYAIPGKPDGPRVPAVTEIHRLAVYGRYSLVEALPRTGRLHQIRRHLKHIACPLIGDVNYGKGEHNRLFRDRYGLHRLALHAASLTVPHPADGRPIHADAPMPADLSAPIVRLAKATETP
jgi:tRNA pseudouridine65 synthase